MGEDMLNGLAVIQVNYEEVIFYEKIIDRFARQKNRNLDFILT